MPDKRSRIYVDKQVQRALALRAVGYWLFFLLTVCLTTTCWVIWTERPTSSEQLVSVIYSRMIPPLLASLLPVPLIVIDCVRLSNRFAGPMFRMRRVMNAAADGQTVKPLHFRPGDFWNEFADDFNRLMKTVQTHRRSAEGPETPSVSTEDEALEPATSKETLCP